MARRPKKHLGKGVKVSILVKYLQPSRLVSCTLPNTPSNHRLGNCTVVGRDTKTIHQKRQRPAIIIQHESFKSTNSEDGEIYALPKWFKIIEEEPSEQFFGESRSTDVTNPMNNVDISTEHVEAPLVVSTINKRGRIIDSDLANLNGQVDVDDDDDDNIPTPENIPSSADVKEASNIFSTNLGYDGVCPRRQVEGFHTQAKLFILGGFNGVPKLLQTFKIMFPYDLIKSIIIKETNKYLDK